MCREELSMFFGSVGRSSGRRQRVWSARLVAAATVVLAAVWIAVPAQARSHRPGPRAVWQVRLARHQHEDARLSAAVARAARNVRAHAAAGVRFARGDVFLTGGGAVQEYS